MKDSQTYLLEFEKKVILKLKIFFQKIFIKECVMKLI